MDVGELRSVTRLLALVLASSAALLPAPALAAMEWVGPVAPPGPVEVPRGDVIVEFPADWEVRGVVQESIFRVAEMAGLDASLWRPVVFGLDTRDGNVAFCLVAEGGGWGHSNPTATMPELAKALRGAGYTVKRYEWPRGMAIKLSSTDGTSIYMQEDSSWAQVACGGTSKVPDQVVEDIANSLRFTLAAQPATAVAPSSSSGRSASTDVGVLVLVGIAFMAAVTVLLIRRGRATPSPVGPVNPTPGRRVLAVDRPSTSISATPSGEPHGEIVVESYPGRTQADAAAVFAERAKFMASRGYSPVSQSWSEGRPGVKRVVMLGVFANSIRPDGHLTVTYQRTIPATTSSATPEAAERAVETDAPRPSVPEQPAPAAEPARASTDSVVTRNTGHAEPQRETKTCPDCAETILEAARICRFCRYEFWPEGAPPPSSGTTQEPAITAAAPADMPPTPEREEDLTEPEPEEPEAPSPEAQPAPEWEPAEPPADPEPQYPPPPAPPPGMPRPPPPHAPQPPSYPPPPPTWQPPPQGSPPRQGPPGQGTGPWGPPPPTRPPDGSQQ